jgi:protein-tyrosine phosphatase
MDWITESIAIGNYLEAQDKDLLSREGVRSALSLDGTLKGERAQEFGLDRVVSTVLIDGDGNDLRVFAGAIESLRYLVQTNPPVLVQCHAGRSRSVAVVAGYLMRMKDLDPDDAIALVTAKRNAMLANGLRKLLYKLCDEL